MSRITVNGIPCSKIISHFLLHNTAF
uniref:Uncharacterized protein n=1 Tax=Anguilla anguilla TaxID=7936 RepID=A0A0E9SSA8_ANGAN